MNKRQINISLDKVQRFIDTNPEQLLSDVDIREASARHLATLRSVEVAEAKTFSYVTA